MALRSIDYALYCLELSGAARRGVSPAIRCGEWRARPGIEVRDETRREERRGGEKRRGERSFRRPTGRKELLSPDSRRRDATRQMLHCTVQQCIHQR